jgi:hypothetical protein
MSSMVHPRIGLILPCRNEAAVIERKLRNLAQLDLEGVELQLIVVDDHSTDGTAERARKILESMTGQGFVGRVVANEVRPGKNGAIEGGLGLVAGSVDLVVLTDADVLVEPQALRATHAAFARDEDLGMACGSQVFVASLADGGQCAGADGAAPQSAMEAWDRVTARVRRFESRRGKLFSVHGQWLAWRAELGLLPSPGVAADDVDLMLQVRSGDRPRVRMLSEVRFFECKPPAAHAGEQGLRRARAWFQVFQRREAPLGLSALDRLQWWSYATLPGRLPELVAVGAVSAALFCAWIFGPPGVLAVALMLALVAVSPFGREWLQTLGLILRARRLERTEAMSETWEMSRE